MYDDYKNIYQGAPDLINQLIQLIDKKFSSAKEYFTIKNSKKLSRELPPEGT